MRIVARYSFNNGAAEVAKRYPHLLKEIEAVVGSIDANKHKTKTSEELTMMGMMLFNPSALNKEFKREFKSRGWEPKKIYCEYSSEYYIEDYKPTTLKGPKPYREMDFLKEKLGVEVQFGKYAFMVYNVCAKMTIFRNLGHIDCGVEIVPVRGFTQEMSTGVAYFEQFTWDLKNRGTGDIDIPVLILGIDADVLIEAGSEASVAGEAAEVTQVTLLPPPE
jgi:Restriction endonuclease BglII